MANLDNNVSSKALSRIFELLLAAYGPQRWWPAQSATEVVIGAILTQNTAWPNVERAIRNLKQTHCLDFSALRDISTERLGELIRPSGTYRVKAKRLKSFVDYLWSHYDGSLEAMLIGDLYSTRQRLLSIHGIGPETADAILLYAGQQPTFVIDTYTKRLLRRHFLIDVAKVTRSSSRASGPSAARSDYESVQELFHHSLPADAKLFNEYHALLVEVGKRHCRTKADCRTCPLTNLRHDGDL